MDNDARCRRILVYFPSRASRCCRYDDSGRCAPTAENVRAPAPATALKIAFLNLSLLLYALIIQPASTGSQAYSSIRKERRY